MTILGYQNQFSYWDVADLSGIGNIALQAKERVAKKTFGAQDLISQVRRISKYGDASDSTYADLLLSTYNVVVTKDRAGRTTIKMFHRIMDSAVAVLGDGSIKIVRIAGEKYDVQNEGSRVMKKK